MPVPEPEPESPPPPTTPTWPELLGRRPSVLTEMVDKRLRVRAWLLGLGMALFSPFTGCLWLIVKPFEVLATSLAMALFYPATGCLVILLEPLALAAVGLMLARSAHHRTWEMDPHLRLLPLKPRDRVAGLATVVAGFWTRVLVLPFAVLFVAAVLMLGSSFGENRPEVAEYLASAIMVLTTGSARLAILYLLLLYTVLTCTQARLAVAESRRPSMAGVMFLGFAACAMSWLPAAVLLPAFGPSALLAGAAAGTAIMGVLLWLLARSAWRSLEVAYADAE